MHCMIDIETLGTKADSVVLTIGALRFDPFSDDDPSDGLHLYLEVDEQTRNGRLVSEDTLQWWAEQEEEVRSDVFREDGRSTVKQALDSLHSFVKDADAVWAQGPTFDMVILENLYASYGRSAPWRYSRVRDSRTLFAVLGDPRGSFPMAHNALVDCYHQAKGIQMCLSKLRQGEVYKDTEYAAQIGL